MKVFPLQREIGYWCRQSLDAMGHGGQFVSATKHDVRPDLPENVYWIGLIARNAPTRGLLGVDR